MEMPGGISLYMSFGAIVINLGSSLALAVQIFNKCHLMKIMLFV